jgi:hypothetical protein
MRARTLSRLSLFCIGVLLLGAVLASSQATTNGVVSGQVTDQSGGVIPGAEVVLVDTATQQQLRTTTNAAGRYVIVNVVSGHYVLKVTHEGFTSENISNIDVSVGSTVVVNAQLKVGSSKQTVTVEANTITELQTTSATVGNTIDSKAILLLPNLGRDVTTLTVLQPAVTQNGFVAGAYMDQNTYQLDGGNNTDDMAGNTIGYQTNFTGMGGSQTSAFASGVVPTPLESIEEVKVSVAGQGIDFNNSIGSNVQMTTKRGTSQFHGSAYEYYFSTTVGDANTWANDHTIVNGAANPIVSNHRNRYGFAVGGPAVTKNILGGKTYFFFNYEAMRFPNVGSYERAVPTPAFRAGVIQVQNSSGAAQVVNGVSYANGAYIPYNMNPTPVTVAAVPGQPSAAFSGTLAPAVCGAGLCDPRGIGLNPVVNQIWSKQMPLPGDYTGASGDTYNTAGFLSSLRQTQRSTFMVGRIDHDFGDKNRFYASYRYFEFTPLTNNQVDIGGAIPGDTLGQPAATAPRPQKPSFLVGGLTSNLTPNLINTFVFNYTRTWWQWSDYTPPTSGQLPGMGGMLEIGGESSAALIPFNVNAQSVRQRFWDGQDKLIRDDLTLIKGNHLFQFGGAYQRNFDYHSRTDNGSTVNNEVTYLSQNGVVNFAGFYPASATTSGMQSSWSNLAAEALGIVSQSQVIYSRAGSNLTLQPVGTAAFDKSIIPYYNVYWGDTWHVRPTLTVVYGMAWALEMPPYEINGKQVAVVDQAGNLISAQDYLTTKSNAALAGQNYNPVMGFALVGNVGSGLKYPYNPFYGEFSPRVAAAWNPSFSDGLLGKIFGQGKTVVRGSYGRIYGRLNGVDQVLVPLLSPGFLQGVSCVTLSNGSCGSSSTMATAFRIGTDGLSAPLPVPSNTLPQPFFAGVNGNPTAPDSAALDPSFRPNRTDNFTFSIQRQINRKMTVDIGYIGRITKNDFAEIDLDAVPYMYTLGGQQFSQAWANAYLSLCGAQVQCAGSGATAAQAAAIVPTQAFFETALGGTSSAFCKGFTSCTAAVMNNATMLSSIKADSVSNLWNTLNKQSSWLPGASTISQLGLANSIDLNTSLGHSNYNGAYVSFRAADFKGLTLQSNFTWSHALGTGELAQYNSSATLLDPYHISAPANYGTQNFDVRLVYNMIMYYQPPYFKNQKGILGHLLGGWTISPLFTAQSGNGTAGGYAETGQTCGACQAFGEVASGSSSFSAVNQDAVGTGTWNTGFSRINGVTTASTATINGINGATTTVAVGSTNPTGMGAFANPGQVWTQLRPCILGYDTSCGGYYNLTGLLTWNLDATFAKDFSFLKDNRVGGTLIFQITNVVNHFQPSGPSLTISSPATFGRITGQANTPRNMEFGLRLHF